MTRSRSDSSGDAPAYPDVHQALLLQHCPPSLLISPDDSVAHLSADAGQFLIHPGGPPTTSIFRLVLPELELELRSVLEDARRQKAPTWSAVVPVPLDVAGVTESRAYRLKAIPAPPGKQEGFVLIVFEDQGSASTRENATLFLDRELRIQRFTPKITDVFNVRATDRGRPLSEITHRLHYDELTADILRVLDDSAPIERVVHGAHGRSYLMRVHAHRGTDDRITGTVITFVDITERARAEHDLRVSKEKYRALFDSIEEGFALLQLEHEPGDTNDFVIVESNAAFSRNAERTLESGHTSLRGFFEGESQEWFDTFHRVRETGKSTRFEHRLHGSDRTLELHVFRSGKPESGQLGVLLKDITDYKRSLERMRRSEEFHRLAVQAGGVGTWGHYVDSEVFYVSPQMATLLGYAAEYPKNTCDQTQQLQISSSRLRETVHPEDRQKVAEAMFSLPSDARNFSLEFRIIVGTSVRWLYSAGGITRDGEESPFRIRGAAIDITERKRAEEHLKENEENLALELAAMKELHELVSRLIVCRDQQTALEEVVRSTVEVTDAYMGCIQMMNPETGSLNVVAGEKMDANLRELLETPESWERYRALEVENGARVLLEDATAGLALTQEDRSPAQGLSAQLSPLMGRKGQFLGVLASFYPGRRVLTRRDLWILDLYSRQVADLIERTGAEDALRQSEAQFRAMFDVSSVAALQMNPETGEIIRLNETFLAMTSYSLAECLERSFFDFLHPADREAANESGGFDFSESGTYQQEQRFVAKNGRVFWGLIAANLVPHSSPVQAVVLVLDVTSRRDAESSLERQNRQKDEFIAMLGHELRNPLAAIRNATDLLKLIPIPDRRADRARKTLDRQSTHMARLIDGLLEISRIARGKVRIDVETIDLREVVEPILDDRKAEIEKLGLELVRIIPSFPLWTRADAVRMAQVFDNLISNAMKFTPRPGKITLSLEREDGSVVAWVSDTGKGIRPEVLPHVFETFHQDDQAEARCGGGLGLGLALAKGLVELHNGSIAAHSAGSDAGAQFEVRLPHADPPTSSRPPAPLRTTSPLEILLVEDNVDAAEMLQTLLEMRGHRTAWADCAEAALKALRERTVDVVLCDLGLPDMTGLELCEKVRNELGLRELFMVAVTGFGQPQDRERTQAAGFNRHLVKPIELQTLTDVLADVTPTR